MKRRRILRDISIAAALPAFAGCIGEGAKEGYIQADTGDDVPADAAIVEYESVNWESREMVQQVVQEAYASGTASMSVNGNQYQKAERQLNSLEADYIEYKNTTVAVYLATEQ